MFDNPLISIIMSVYNEERYIFDSIKSILDQTYKHFEVIIVDDCSTDGTVAIIESFNDDRIRIVKNKANQGLTKNLNKALHYAKGDYIARMDGDDICIKNRLKLQLEYLEKHPDVYLISCRAYCFGNSNFLSETVLGIDNLNALLLIRPVLYHPGFMFRRDLVDKGIVYDETYRTAQDYDYQVRVAEKYKIGIVNKVLIRYRIHDKQVSNKKIREQNDNAKRTREYQFDRLGLMLDNNQIDIIASWSDMKSHCDISSAFTLANIIGEIEKASKCKHVYGSSKSVEFTLYKELFKWIIRSKSGIEPIKVVLNSNSRSLGAFLCACYEIIRHRTETVIYSVMNNHK